MVNLANEYRQLSPEIIWLESEDLDQARIVSQQVNDQAKQWKTYLNTLAFLSFTKWLKKRERELVVPTLTSQINDLKESVCRLIVNQFQTVLLIIDNLSESVVFIPKTVIDVPELAAHFYVLIELDEEEEQAIIRGFLRYDKLEEYRRGVKLQIEDGNYLLPLSLFDPEPNHLLVFCRFLQPSAIPLPQINTAPQLVINHISRWLDGMVDAAWKTIDAIEAELIALQIHPADYLLQAARSGSDVAHPYQKRYKLLNQKKAQAFFPENTRTMQKELGEKLLLSVEITPIESSSTLKFAVEAIPLEKQSNLQLILLDEDGDTIMAGEAKGGNILLDFSAEIDDRFSIEVILDDFSFQEAFVL